MAKDKWNRRIKKGLTRVSSPMARYLKRWPRLRPSTDDEDPGKRLDMETLYNRCILASPTPAPRCTTQRKLTPPFFLARTGTSNAAPPSKALMASIDFSDHLVMGRKQPIDPQTTSRLLQMSPELRNMTYDAILDGKWLHIMLKETQKRMGYFRCEEPCVPQYKGVQREIVPSCLAGKINNAGMLKDRIKTDGDIIPFLRSCRRVYAELIDMVYTSRYFHFPNLFTFRQFRKSTLPNRWMLIRRLCITQDYSDYKGNQSTPFQLLVDHPVEQIEGVDFEAPNLDILLPRRTTWNIVANLSHLQDLRVALIWCGLNHPRTTHGHASFDEMERQFLKPLNQISRPQTFELLLTYPGQRIKDAPYTLIRPASDFKQLSIWVPEGKLKPINRGKLRYTETPGHYFTEHWDSYLHLSGHIVL
ncbi:hypothetical protein EK21DRAFT_117249 [Setomelanomma holmii]|uniref:DUF7730 domain-containing protein n=1 Tax=Setomelanomma holmii TaxID=210430 RepID=A0A9P4LH33_9PLEO|nr:hypothetical protein EK21DRAFT_117249 [Setomelanomma holmii]